MELCLYWQIIRKRLWIIVLLLVVLTLSYVAVEHGQAATYTANMRFVVGLRPESNVEHNYTYDRYYTWLTAEYLIDDLAEVVKSQVFAQDVATLAGVAVPPGSIQGATAAGKLHRILTVSITWHDPDELSRIANAVVQVLRERGGSYFAQLTTENTVISLIDPPAVVKVAPSLRQRLDLPLRLILALFLGIVLAFLLDYIDDTVRHRADLEQLGIVILAQVPAERPWFARIWRRRGQP